MQTKDSSPINFLKNRTTLPIIEMYFEFNHLKQLYRQGWLKRGVPESRCESVAEHSFAVALLSLFLADIYYLELDLFKVIKMALIHDIGEIYTGDLIPADNVASYQKYQLEKKSISRVLGKLPKGLDYISIWEEFEEGESQEAQFVRQIDRLEMAFQAGIYENQNFIDPSEFFETVKQDLALPELKDILKELETLRLS